MKLRSNADIDGASHRESGRGTRRPKLLGAKLACMLALAGVAVPAVDARTPQGDAHVSLAGHDQLKHKLDARDRRRAQNLRVLYHSSGGWDRWIIRSVRVHRGSIEIKTGLYPKSSNAPAFIGACTMAMGGRWVSSIDVYGRDGLRHSSWLREDAGCRTLGL